MALVVARHEFYDALRPRGTGISRKRFGKSFVKLFYFSGRQLIHAEADEVTAASGRAGFNRRIRGNGRPIKKAAWKTPCPSLLRNDHLCRRRAHNGGHASQILRQHLCHIFWRMLAIDNAVCRRSGFGMSESVQRNAKQQPWQMAQRHAVSPDLFVADYTVGDPRVAPARAGLKSTSHAKNN